VGGKHEQGRIFREILFKRYRRKESAFKSSKGGPRRASGLEKGKLDEKGKSSLRRVLSAAGSLLRSLRLKRKKGRGGLLAWDKEGMGGKMSAQSLKGESRDKTPHEQLD